MCGHTLMDGLAQIWSVETALLLCTCRGHRAEITDLAVNVDNTLFASSSNDHTVRCWSLQARLYALCSRPCSSLTTSYCSFSVDTSHL